MQEFENLLNKVLQKSVDDIENKVAVFYLRFLFDEKDQSMLMNASTILVSKDRAKLPAPNGRYESAILKRKSTLKKDFLNAQLCDIVDTYGNQLRMKGELEKIRKKLDARLDKFIKETSQKMSAEVQRGLMQNISPFDMTQNLTGVFSRAAKQVGAFAQDCYTQAGWYRFLKYSEENSDQRYTIVVFETEGTCDRCRSHGGKLYTLEELAEKELLPPLHPNCQCAVVPISDNAETKDQKNWYDPLLRIPEDAWNMLQAYAREQEARFKSGTLSGILDGLTLGIVSGFFGGLYERNEKMWQDPSIYNIGNWLTLGLFDLTKGAFNPDEPLSLQHWMDSIGFATAMYGAYKVGQGVRGNGKLDKKPTADTDTSANKVTAGSVNGFDTRINSAKQGKHIVGNNNYTEGRSVFYGTIDDAQALVNQYAGTGEWIGANKERINFRQVIGRYINPITGEAADTTVGIIHYSKTGTHIVPARPVQ